MPISCDTSRLFFHLETPRSSYCIAMVKGGLVAHAYYGPRLRNPDPDRLIPFFLPPCTPNPDPGDQTYSLDVLPREYPSGGSGDYRHPGVAVRGTDGSTVMDLRYVKHDIISGKPGLRGLPSTSGRDPGDTRTLLILTRDEVSGIEVELSYTVFEGLDAVARSARIINGGNAPCDVETVLSACVDLQPARYDMITLQGAWVRETVVERISLAPGIREVGSCRGASSNYANPFMAVAERGATETSGNVFGFSFVYSGNFAARAEMNHYGSVRASIGLNPHDFSWRLEPGHEFQAPEAVLAFSSDGLGGMSRTYHDLWRKHLLPPSWTGRKRPVLVNSWEAAYFGVNEKLVVDMAREAKGLGLELFALDDGWFGKRDDDTGGLGDWTPNAAKFPRGLEGVAAELSGFGMEFGIWVEPEAVSPDSDLFRDHPDWCVHVPGRPMSVGRNQYTLDFSRDEVKDHVAKAISGAISASRAVYVKWDMNRSMTEIGSAALPPGRARETAHRYMLGLYDVIRRITSRFPGVLFEGCSSGGGRYDPGMLAYMPQFWASDDTDAWERCSIQRGASLVYPAETMSCHVSVVPNHQTGRSVPFETRVAAAMAGVPGFELDPFKMPAREREAMGAALSFMERVSPVVMGGDLFRISDPDTDGFASWIHVTGDKKKAVLTFVRGLCVPNSLPGHAKAAGLSAEFDYIIEAAYGDAETEGAIMGGDEIMARGLPLPFGSVRDFSCAVWFLAKA